MTETVRWAGLSKRGDQRIWGYIENPSFPWKNPSITTFWGKKDGNIHFQEIRNGSEFKVTLRRKKEKYAEKPELVGRVAEEYEKIMIMKKLKGNII
jgi:hypothetical protein